MLDQTLEAILHKVRDSRAVMVVGLDGFIIEQQGESDLHLTLEAMAAELAALLRQAQSSSSSLGFGNLDELDVRTDHFYVLIQRITSDYFLCLLLDLNGNFGRGRFELKKARRLLVGEFAI